MEDKKEVLTVEETTREAVEYWLEKIEPMKADVYVLKIDEGIRIDHLHDINEGFKRIWEEHKIKAPLVIMPSIGTLNGYNLFDFNTALKLLKAGCKVQRTDWDGYLYMLDGVIYHSSDIREWKPTQKAVLACNWRIA
jgi:hypothetical protein